MASAEARGAWGTNCEFVQEDVRSASQLSCCSSSLSKSESDGRTGEAVNKSDHPSSGCVPKMSINLKSSDPNVHPETNQWPHWQANCGHEKNFSCEWLSSLELELLSANFVDEIVKFDRKKLPTMEDGNQADVKDNAVSFLAQQRKKSSSYMENEQDPKIQEIESLISNNLPKNKDAGELWYAEDHLIDLDSFILASEEPEKFCSDLEPHWIKVEKSVPWWRAADKDELASLVSCKSIEHVMNSDLPQPQTENLGGKGSIHLQWFEHSKAVDSSSDQMADKQVPYRANNAQGSPRSGSLDGQHGRQCSPGDAGRPPLGLDRPFRSTTLSNKGSNTTSMDEVETPQRAVVDLSKAQLLQALCHSQTRAREAEKAAQKAYDEKEHITMLFFRQASYLFAYRQWFQILRLENLCLQLKSKDQPTSIHFPVFLPWITSKNRKMRKGKHKVTKRKLHPPRKKIRKRLVAFAVGLSCAGAGLLLGWIMGFLFISF